MVRGLKFWTWNVEGLYYLCNKNKSADQHDFYAADLHLSAKSRFSHDKAHLMQTVVAKINSLVMRKPMFCICENKDADQLRGNREADQRLCFRYIDSTIPLLSKSEISSLQPSLVTVQPGFCRTSSGSRMLVFS